MATANTIQTEVIKQNITNGMALNAAIVTIEDDTQFLFDKIFPSVNVNAPAGQAWVLKTSDGQTKVNDIITPESAPNRIGSEWATVNFSTENHALRYFIPDEQVNLIQNGGTLLTQQAVAEVTKALRANGEIRFIDKFLNTTNSPWKTKITGNTSASNVASNTIMQWDNGAATILDDIDNIKEANAKYAGNLKMNRAVMSADVWRAIKRNPEVAEKLQAGADTVKFDEALKVEFAKLIEVERVDVLDNFVADFTDTVKTVTDTTDLYNTNLTFSRQLSKYFALYHYEPAISLRTRSAGLIVNYGAGLVDFNNGIPQFTSYRHADEGVWGTYVDGRIAYGMIVTNPAAWVEVTKVLA